MKNNTIVKREAEEMVTKEITADLYQEWINYLDVSPKTVETYRRSLKQFFKYIYENGITQPKREDVLSYKRSLQERLKPATVQAYIVAVRLFFTWTEQEGLYPNVAEHIKGAKVSKGHKKDYLTSGQVKQILGQIDRTTKKGKRDYAILSLMLTGGLRTIEIVRANIEDLRTVGDSTALFIQGKGRQERNEFVKIMRPVEEAIREYLKTRPKSTKDTDPLFTSLSNNSRGERLTTRSASRIVKSRFKSAGFDSERLTAHSTRHTAVTLALLNGESLEEVQQFARHSSINTTLIYAHNLERVKNTCEQTIANAIF